MNSNVTLYAVRIPLNGNAPHGRTVKFTTKRERDFYLKRCCDQTRALTIPPISR